ncbi:unnamed protein product [Sphagnum jensenii]|uniref:Pantothenate kinase n=1 Tax=Sphagnum jensenii TaxID=128206 RepID=A0ABP0VD02_9BRYO
MDVGGTLTKIVYFEADLAGSDSRTTETKKVAANSVVKPSLKRGDSLNQLDQLDHQLALHQLYKDMTNINVTNGKVATIRDTNLSFYSDLLGGRMHFLHFETRNMIASINLLSSTAITENITTIGCTGGGAVKYAKIFQEVAFA